MRIAARYWQAFAGVLLVLAPLVLLQEGRIEDAPADTGELAIPAR